MYQGTRYSTTLVPKKQQSIQEMLYVDDNYSHFFKVDLD